jgi:hypothetical protein
MKSTKHLRWQWLAAGLAAAAAIVAIAVPSASAAGPSTPVAANDVGPTQTYGHTCENFGEAVQGYRAGHCIDFDLFRNSAGQVGIRAQTQAFCQRVSDGVVVQCASIDMSIEINNDQGYLQQRFPKCGARIGHTPCPKGRFTVLTKGLLCDNARDYGIFIDTTISLPGSGASVRGGFATFSRVNPCSQPSAVAPA